MSKVIESETAFLKRKRSEVVVFGGPDAARLLEIIDRYQVALQSVSSVVKWHEYEGTDRTKGCTSWHECDIMSSLRDILEEGS